MSAAASTSPPTITVISQVRHPRLRYTLKVVGEDLGYRFVFHNESPLSSTPPRYPVYYGGHDHHLARFYPHPLLSGRDTAPARRALFETENLLARIFLALSRYEEYAPDAPRDAHGRFPASASDAYREGYLERPVVREWTAEIGRRLREWFPDLPPTHRREMRFVPTYDIDLLWAYHHRGWRGMASGVKDSLTGHARRAYHRLTSTEVNDPYNTIAALEALHGRNQLQARYFWLVSSKKDRRDTNPYPLPSAQRALMRTLDGDGRCGLHPSYGSSNDPSMITEEKHRIEAVLARTVEASRQHFVRFDLPDTYRHLYAAGIRHEYSMGYADAVGWRAGTNLPFRWYDLGQERETQLIVYPFAAMDVTLRNYLGLDAEAARDKVLALAENVRPHGGPFTLLWHNSSFADDYGWAGWWEAYAALVAELAALGQTK